MTDGEKAADTYERERARAQEQQRAARTVFLQKLMGTPDRHDWQAPKPLENIAVALGEHAAQLRNAARYLMEHVLSDTITTEENAGAIASLTSIVRANVAIAKILTPAPTRKTEKTVQGVPTRRSTQD